ncbi:O-acetyltransferase OatA [Pandoraea communis]|uniref:O-acetyltransferase OatA n=1 Tax=Pandoraea communis TaxID=2508297 RepID=A0A5E4Z390_9BURK|nr:acyltransferase family protein [Pandoraea communis]VVE55187.1 O-acetyltransferase OatA [Pandoraea communis]
MKPAHSYLRHIDGLRALAVLAVVVFHAFPSAIPGGFVGVDIFFVISGYLISGILIGQLEVSRFNILDFYSRRIRRIFPALVLVLAACFVAGWFSLLPGEYGQLGKHIAGGASFSSNFVLWRESGYFDAAAETKPLLHLWSLGIEEQFYIVWPILLYAIWGKRTRVITVLAAILCGSLVLSVWKTGANPTEAFYSPLTRAWELACGALLAILTQRQGGDREWMPARFGSIGAGIGVALILMAFALLNSTSRFPGWWALLPVLGATMIIWAGPDNFVNRRLLSNPLMVGIGLISYPLYLWHWPLLSFARIMEAGTPSWHLRAVLVAASFLLAWLTYRYVELPLKKLRLKFSTAIPLAGFMAVIGAVGIAVFLDGGAASRYPATIKVIADFKYEYTVDARFPDCWLGEKMAPDAFSSKCFAHVDGERNFLLWGDSHSARLYPGLAKVLAQRGVNVMQTSRDSCPPVLHRGSYANCKRGNEYVLSRLHGLNIDTVVLFAAWGRYAIDWENNMPARKDLADTISAIHAQGIKKVIVIGPAPEWPDALPKLVYRGWEADYPAHRIPERLNVKLVEGTVQADIALAKVVPEMGATFIPLMSGLCNSGGCLTHTPGAPTELMTWDYGHLTTPGAIYISKMIENRIL